VTRPRAADDFPMIRARMEELRRERARPRAADDFAMIRARMGGAAPRARPSVGRSAGAFGDPSEALSSRHEYETEHEGRQHSPRVISGPELNGGWIRYGTGRKDLAPTLSPRSSG
jgi:hypothetical protein